MSCGKSRDEARFSDFRGVIPLWSTPPRLVAASRL
jgi:hypothetical protein